MPFNVFSVTNLYQYPPSPCSSRSRRPIRGRGSQLAAQAGRFTGGQALAMGVTHRWTTLRSTREKTEKSSQPYMTAAGIPILHLHGFYPIPPFIP